MQKGCDRKLCPISSPRKYASDVGFTVSVWILHRNRRHMREITQTLPTDLDAKVAAEFVFDETYWKKRCEAWLLQGPCHIYEHGMTWKQYYFEKYVQKVVHRLWLNKREDYQGLESCQTEEKTSTLAILPVISTCQDYIFTLKVTYDPNLFLMSRPQGTTATNPSRHQEHLQQWYN